MKTKKSESKKRKALIKILQINALVVFSWSMFAPFVVVIGQERNMSLQQAGSAWALYTLACGVVTLIAGRLEDGLHKHGAMYVTGIFSMLMGSLAGAFIQNTSGIYISLGLFALGFGLANPALKTIYSKIQVKGEEASEWAWMDGGNMLIMSGAAFLAAYIVQQFGVTTLFLIMIPLFLSALMLGIRLFGLLRYAK